MHGKEAVCYFLQPKDMEKALSKVITSVLPQLEGTEKEVSLIGKHIDYMGKEDITFFPWERKEATYIVANYHLFCTYQRNLHKVKLRLQSVGVVRVEGISSPPRDRQSAAYGAPGL